MISLIIGLGFGDHCNSIYCTYAWSGFSIWFCASTLGYTNKCVNFLEFESISGFSLIENFILPRKLYLHSWAPFIKRPKGP